MTQKSDVFAMYSSKHAILMTIALRNASLRIAYQKTFSEEGNSEISQALT